MVRSLFLVLDVWLLRYDWPSSTLSRGRRPRAPSQGTVFCAGSFGSVNFRVPGFTCLSVWGGLLLLHLEKKRKDLPLSGFHLDVQCSDQYEGYWGSCTRPGRVSVYVSECICKRNERQRFPFGDVRVKDPFRYPPFMQYDLASYAVHA